MEISPNGAQKIGQKIDTFWTKKKLTVFQNLTKLPPARPPARRTCNRERKVKCVRPKRDYNLTTT